VLPWINILVSLLQVVNWGSLSSHSLYSWFTLFASVKHTKNETVS
jgi:hypothetical protein